MTVHIRTQKEEIELFDRELASAEKRHFYIAPTEARLSPTQLPIISVVSPVADWFLLVFDPSKERPSITPFTQRQAKYAEWIWAELERQNRSNPAMHIQLVGGKRSLCAPSNLPIGLCDQRSLVATCSQDTRRDSLLDSSKTRTLESASTRIKRVSHLAQKEHLVYT